MATGEKKEERSAVFESLTEHFLLKVKQVTELVIEKRSSQKKVET